MFVNGGKYHVAHKNFRKVYCMFSGSIVALITPFTSENSIDFECVTNLVEWHIESGTSGIVVAGTTGESPTLSVEEKIALAKHVVAVSRGRCKVIVGNGTNCTASSCHFTKQLNDTGIDGYLTVTPFYNKPTSAGLIAHFTEIAKATSLPIILYNVPSRTGCDMANDVVAKLSELSNIVGLKDATGDLDRVQPLRVLCGQTFKLLSGDDVTSTKFCRQGGDGIISVTANVVPKQMAKVQLLLQTNKIDAALEIDQQLQSLHNDLFLESNPIVVKWALYILNKISNASLRLPLTMISSQSKKMIEQTMNKLKLYPQES